MSIAIIGEILLRLSVTDRQTFENNNEISYHYGGAEYNVACHLANWGNNVNFYSTISDDEISVNSLKTLKSFGVNCNGIEVEHSTNPLGVYFYQPKIGKRNSNVIYNRTYSNFSQNNFSSLNSDEISLNDYLYISGISFAAAKNGKEKLLKIVKDFKKSSKTIFFDFNYRSKLWSYNEAKIVYNEILSLADYVSLSMKDISLILKLHNYDEQIPLLPQLKGALEVLFNKYPNIKMIYFTDRKITDNGYIISAYYCDNKQILKSDEYEVDNIIDRVGTGDAFSSAFVHLIVNGMPLKEHLNLPVVANVLKHYYFGDTADIKFHKLIDEIKLIDVSR